MPICGHTNGPLDMAREYLGTTFFIGSLAALEVLLGSMIVRIVSFWIIEINKVFVVIDIIFLNIIFSYNANVFPNKNFIDLNDPK
jgi:hypothetical protein